MPPLLLIFSLQKLTDLIYTICKGRVYSGSAGLGLKRQTELEILRKSHSYARVLIHVQIGAVTLSELFHRLSETYLLYKERIYSLGGNVFLLQKIPIEKWLDVQEGKQEVIKVALKFVNYGGKNTT